MLSHVTAEQLKGLIRGRRTGLDCEEHSLHDLGVFSFTVKTLNPLSTQLSGSLKESIRVELLIEVLFAIELEESPQLGVHLSLLVVRVSDKESLKLIEVLELAERGSLRPGAHKLDQNAQVRVVSAVEQIGHCLTHINRILSGGLDVVVIGGSSNVLKTVVHTLGVGARGVEGTAGHILCVVIDEERATRDTVLDHFSANLRDLASEGHQRSEW